MINNVVISDSITNVLLVPAGKTYAGVGMYYDATNDVFYNQQPFASWTLNKTSWEWDAPYACPELTEEQYENVSYYKWDEDLYQSDNTKGWVLEENPFDIS